MNRLTEKDLKGICTANYTYSKVALDDEYGLALIMNKLGASEDIEEKHNMSLDEIDAYITSHKQIEKELSIDLITLFNALNGFWHKEYLSYKDDSKYYISFRNGLIRLNIEDKQIEEWWQQKTGGFELICYDDFKNYGKTWAITREELK